MAKLRRGQGTIFKDPIKKKEMLAYRASGYTYPQLALHYVVDSKTIIYHCRKAGFMDKTKGQRKKIVALVKAGKTIEEVAKMYSVPRTVISSYCVRLGMKGAKIIENTQKLVLQLPSSLQREKRNTRRTDYVFKRTPPSPRPGWIKESGIWTCAGKRIEQVRKEQDEREKRNHNLKRIEMLSY